MTEQPKEPMGDMERIRLAVDYLAAAAELLAQRTVHDEIGGNDARAVLQLAKQARSALRITEKPGA